MPSSIFSDEQSPPPSPVLEYPKVRLNDLADPPANWQFLGETVPVTMRARRFPKQRLETIVNHHSWGIDMGLTRRTTIEKLLKALWKLFYHMAPDHQPTSFDELADFSRDAGPRLLSCTAGIERVPISRYYPQPPADSKALSSRFKRPSDASESISDSFLEQMSYPVSGGPVDLDATEDEMEEVGQEQEQEQAGVVGNTISPLRSVFSRQGSSVSQLVQTERHTARPLPAKGVVEIVQRVVMKLANADLERHHTAASLERPRLVASNEQALLKTIERKVPATAQVRIAWNRETDEMTLHPDGRDYPYRGRGPVGVWNTSPIDCIIVAAKLLDAGSTVVDRCKKGWRAQFTPLEWALIAATEVDWDLCFPAQSGTLRDHFWQVVSDSLPEIWKGDTFWLQEIWSKATANFAQFQFTYHDQFRHCACGPSHDLGDATGPWRSSSMQPSEVPEDSQGHVTMQARLAREFAPEVQVDCSVCGTPNAITRWRTFESLPARLVTMVDPDAPVTKHTQDLTFEVETFEKRTSVTYRWVGGIYEYRDHFRVFWADNRPGEVDRGEVRMYDGSKNSGMIVGGLSYGHPSERVPYGWWARKAIPMVFYERVDNVSPQVLDTVMSSVGSMVEDVGNRKLLAHEIGPWAPSNGVLEHSISEHPSQWVFPSAEFFNLEPPVNHLASPLTEQSYPLGMQDSPVDHTALYSSPPTPRIDAYPASPPMDSFLPNPISSLDLEKAGLGENESMLDFQAATTQNLASQSDPPVSGLPTADPPGLGQQHPSDAELLQKYGVNYTCQNYMSDYYNAAMQVYYMMNKGDGNTGKNGNGNGSPPQQNAGNSMLGYSYSPPGGMNKGNSNTSSNTSTDSNDNGNSNISPQRNTGKYFASSFFSLGGNGNRSPRQNPDNLFCYSRNGTDSSLWKVGGLFRKQQSQEQQPPPPSVSDPQSCLHSGQGSTAGYASKARRLTGQNEDRKRKRGSPDRKNKRKKKHQRFKKKKQAIREIANRGNSRLQTPEGW